MAINQSVNFSSPNSPDAQDYQIQQAQQLAQLLRTQAGQPIELAAPNAPISWTQGLQKLFEGYSAGQERRLVGKLLNQKNQQAEADVQAKINMLAPQATTTLDSIPGNAPPPLLANPDAGPTLDAAPATQLTSHLMQPNAVPGGPMVAAPSPQGRQLATLLAGMPSEAKNQFLTQALASRYLPPVQQPFDLAEGAKRFDAQGNIMASNPKGLSLEHVSRPLANDMVQEGTFNKDTGQYAWEQPHKGHEPASILAQTNATLTGDALSNAAERYRETGNLPNLGMGSAPLKVKIINKAAELSAIEGDDASAASFRQQANKAGQAALGQLTKQKTITGAFEKTAIANLDLALSKSADVARSGSPLFNRAIIAYKSGVSGDPATASFVNSLVAARNEYAKVLSSSTGAQGITDAGRREAEELFSKVDSPEMLAATVATAKQEMANRMSGFDQQAADLNPLIRAKDNAAPGAAPTAPQAFANESEAASAAAAGKIKSGDKIVVGGQSGTWH